MVRDEIENIFFQISSFETKRDFCLINLGVRDKNKIFSFKISCFEKGTRITKWNLMVEREKMKLILTRIPGIENSRYALLWHRCPSVWLLNLDLSLFSKLWLSVDKTDFQWYSRKDVVHMDRTGIGCILLSSDISHRRISNQGHLYLFVDQIYVERSQKALEYF